MQSTRHMERLNVEAYMVKTKEITLSQGGGNFVDQEKKVACV